MTDSVRIVGGVTEAEVIASFLRGEFESHRWARQLQELLSADGRSPTVVTDPCVTDRAENAYRESLLDRHRGWQKREGLFVGFPDRVDWFRAALTREQVLAVRYIDWDWWRTISAGSRLPLDAARRIRLDEVPGSTAESHEPIAARLRGDDLPPELIVVAPPDYSKLVLVEGHVRLTAYALYPRYLPDSLEIFLGVSDDIERWCQF